MERGGEREWLDDHVPDAAPRIRVIVTELDDALQQRPAALRAKLTKTLSDLYTELKADSSRRAAARAARRPKHKSNRMRVADVDDIMLNLPCHWGNSKLGSFKENIGWTYDALPWGEELSEARVEELRAAGSLPRLAPLVSEAQGGMLAWRCDRVGTRAMANAGIGCVLRALCSAMACCAKLLGLWRDAVIKLAGGGGLQLDFSSLQAGLDRLRAETDAPAGAIIMQHMRGLYGGWSLLELSVGVYIFGAWLRTRSGMHHPHAICYNAEARLLYLGMVTLAVFESDLADIGTFVEELELDYGIYCRELTDARRVFINPSHPSAHQLPFSPPEQLSPEVQFTRRVRRK